MISENISEKNGYGNSPGWRDKLFACVTALFFFLLPLQTRWIVRAPLDHGVPYEWGTLSIYGVEIIGWVIIAFGIIQMRNVKYKIKNVKSFWLLGFLTVFSFLSIAWAPDKLVAFQGAMVLLEGVILYSVVNAIYSPSPGLRPPSPAGRGQGEGVVWALISGAVAQSFLGIYQFLTQFSFASKWLGMALHDPRALGTSVVEFADERWLRAYGGLPHPNVLGGFLVVALAMTVVMWQKSQKSQMLQEDAKILPDKTTCGRMWFCQLALKVVVPILLTGIFFSFSRAAWIAAGGLLVYWVIGVLKIPSPQSSPTGRGGLIDNPSPIGRGEGEGQTVWSGRCYALLITLYILFLAFAFRPLVFTRVASESRLEVKSRVERVEGLREAWMLIKKHPVLGVGMGNYTQAVARELRPGQPLYSYQPAHNVFLLIWAELGIVGLFLFVTVLYCIARQAKFSILNFTFLILLMSDHFLWTLPFGVLLFWGVMGLASNVVRPLPDGRQVLRSRKPRTPSESLVADLSVGLQGLARLNPRTTANLIPP